MGLLGNVRGISWTVLSPGMFHRVSKVPPMDWEKYLEQIELDVVEEPHKPSKFHIAQKEEHSSLT